MAAKEGPSSTRAGDRRLAMVAPLDATSHQTLAASAVGRARSFSSAHRCNTEIPRRKSRSLKICSIQRSSSVARVFGDTHSVASIDASNGRGQNRRVEICWKASEPEAPSNTFDRSQERKVKSSRLFAAITAFGAGLLLSGVAALAQQGPPDCNWKKYLYAQDAVQQGKLDTNMLNQMSALVSAQGYSLTNQSPANLQWLADGGQAL